MLSQLKAFQNAGARRRARPTLAKTVASPNIERSGRAAQGTEHGPLVALQRFLILSRVRNLAVREESLPDQRATKVMSTVPPPQAPGAPEVPSAEQSLDVVHQCG